jgi:hypothetical protein
MSVIATNPADRNPGLRPGPAGPGMELLEVQLCNQTAPFILDTGWITDERPHPSTASRPAVSDRGAGYGGRSILVDLPEEAPDSRDNRSGAGAVDQVEPVTNARQLDISCGRR